MTMKTVFSVARTGSAKSNERFLVVSTGEGEKNHLETLTTKITKLDFGLAFRNGGNPTPIEQYAFQVGTKVYDRFADATAAVLKRHHVKIEAVREDLPTYVQKALDILEGRENISFSEHTEVKEVEMNAAMEAA